MFFFSHRMISKELYRYFYNEVKLDRRLFAYGNIKPDLPSRDRIHHTLENCLGTVAREAELLMDTDMTWEDFSVSLGVICHYLCDFFCYYHLNEDIHNKKLHHFLYELGIHAMLIHLRLQHKLKIQPNYQLLREDITTIILEERVRYQEHPHSMRCDIEFALSSAVWICESILRFTSTPLERMPIETKEYQELVFTSPSYSTQYSQTP